MNSRHLRFITSEDFPFPFVNVFVTEDSVAVRLLTKVEIEEEEAKQTGYKNKSQLMTTDKLASPNMSVCEKSSIRVNTLTKIGNEYYFINSEYIFNKSDPRQARSQSPSSILIFTIKLSGDRILRCYERSLETYTQKQDSNNQLTNEKMASPFQMIISSEKDDVLSVSKSISARQNGVITNINLKSAVYQDPKFIQENKNASQFLMPKYIIEHPESVKPNATFDCKVVALDGSTSVLLEDIDYDGFEIEAVDGYVPHKRVAMKGGIGSFRATALGLMDGETMRIKFGKKFHPGLAECTVQIKE